MTGGDLGEAFGGSARGRRDLGGMLPPRRPATEPAAPSPTAAEPEPSPDPVAPVPPRQRQPRTTRRTPPAPEPGADTSFQVQVYVLPGVLSAASRRRKDDGLTNAEVAFDAVDAVQSRLPGLVRDRRTKPRQEGSLFPARAVRRPRAGADAGATEGRRVPWVMRCTAAELEVLDRLVASTGAESRSELVSVALEAALLR